MARVCSSSRLPPARSAAADPRIHVQHAHGFAAAGEHAGGVALPGADAHQRHADDAAQFQVGDALAFVKSAALTGSKFMDSSSRRCCSARWITARGTRKSSSRSLCPLWCRATRVSSPPPVAQQQKAALGAGDRQRRIHQLRQHVVHRKRTLQRRARSRMARSLARLPPTPSAGARWAQRLFAAPICSISRFSSAPSSAKISW